jgi:DNA-binding NtrC family response regulator
VDLRWIAASNVDLAAAAREGRFREDLFYRLNVVTIELPPLRARPEDVEPLALATLARLCAREGRNAALAPEALHLLQAYPWPGNVRELLNVIERAVVLCTTGIITPDHLPTHVASTQVSREIRVALGTSLEQVQDRLMEETLRLCDGDKTRAAQMLGVNPRTIYRWLEMKSLQVPSRELREK